MVELRDDPRPQGYWPNTPSQWREPTVDDCTWYAGESAWQSGSNNHLNMNPVKDLREKSIDTVGGTDPLVMMKEMERLWPTSEQVGWAYGGWTAEELKRALAGGACLLIGGDYEKLPIHYRRWTNNDIFNHEMMVKFIDPNDKVFLYDPLGGGPTFQPYDGEWIPFADLFGTNKFTWKKTASTWWAGIVQNLERDAVKKIFAEAKKQVRVARGTPVFPAPRALNHDKKLWEPDQWRDFYGVTFNGWRLIKYHKEDEAQYGYIHSRDVIEARNAPAIPASPPDTDVEALQLANKALRTANQNLTDSNQVMHQTLLQYEEVIPSVRNDLATLP